MQSRGFAFDSDRRLLNCHGLMDIRHRIRSHERQNLR